MNEDNESPESPHMGCTNKVRMLIGDGFEATLHSVCDESGFMCEYCLRFYQQKRKYPYQPTMNRLSTAISDNPFGGHLQGLEGLVDRDSTRPNSVGLGESSLSSDMGNTDLFQALAPQTPNTAFAMQEIASQSEFDLEFPMSELFPFTSASNEPSETTYTANDSAPQLNVEDYDACQQGDSQHGLRHEWQSEMSVDGGTNSNAVEYTNPGFVQSGSFNLNYHSLSSIPNSGYSTWFDQMNAAMASPPPPVPALPEFAGIRPMPRRGSDGPWSHFAAAEGYNRSLGFNGQPIDEMPASDVNPHDDFTSNQISPTGSFPSFPSSFYGTGSTLQPPFHPVSPSSPRRRRSVTSNKSMPPNPYSRSNTRGGAGQRLSVPEFSTSLPVPSSPSPSIVSLTSSNQDIDEVLLCGVGGCDAKFTGAHRKGNRQRHWRLKHRGAPGMYSCMIQGCTKVVSTRLYNLHLSLPLI